MADLTVLNLDGTNRNIKDAASVHSIKINGTEQTKTNQAVDIDLESIVNAKVAAALQGLSFSVDFSTGELTYTLGS